MGAVPSRPVGGSPDAAFGLVHDEPGEAAGPYTAGRGVAIGEVTLHNRAALLADLAAAGAPAPPDCPDGELLLRIHDRFGTAGIRNAEGMFALAIVDGADLLLVRDHVGARTMFYADAHGHRAASTSLRALRRWPALRTGLNLSAVRSFLTFAYVPGEETMLRGVREVPPGCRVRLPADGPARVERYWEPEERIDDTRSPREHAARLRALLEEATARRLPPADPVAVLLSGGVDSSLVTALAAKLHDAPVDTYSICFGRDLPNELAYSGLVATHCGTPHRVLTVSGETVASRLPDTVARLANPVGDPLTVPNLLLAEAVAGDGHRVVLNGEGGDPIFGGPKNLPMLVHELHRDEPGLDARANAYLRSYRKCYTDLPTLLTPAVLAELDTAPPPERFVAPYLRPDGPYGMGTLLNQLLHCNLRTKGAYHILGKVERITASQGLQGRAPLFDRAVVDHAFTVPPRWKLAGTVEKWVLKEAVRDLLPETVIDRPKSGMRVPVQQWLRGPLRDLAGDLLLGPRAQERGLIRGDTVRFWMRGDGSLLPRQGGKLWLVLTLELWLRSYDLG